ncbi:MAG: hypothetical protein EBQ56_10950, partial [Proteobacteria bacterium]|nr:hypothetical protein [Pseudomonadota bacterium]
VLPQSRRGTGGTALISAAFLFYMHLVTAGADRSRVLRTGPSLGSMPGGKKARWVGSAVCG